jgi:predicted nicotinamide N-methyase
MRPGVLSLLVTCVVADIAPRLAHITFGRGQAINLEQEYTDAEEGSVLWDASRTLLAYVTRVQETEGADADMVSGKRLLEIGAGTGAVGLALGRLGARSVVMTDKPSQIPLITRNLEHNQPNCASRCDQHVAPVSIQCLQWGAEWKSESDASLAMPNAFDTIICCDCVYPDRPSGLAGVLLDLLALNPLSTVLLAFEQRPPPAGAPPDTDHTRSFFEEMRAGCDVEQVPPGELDPQWTCDEISLWRMRARDGS